MMIMVYTCMTAAHFTLMTLIYQQARAFKLCKLPSHPHINIAIMLAIILNAICLGYAISNMAIQIYIAAILGY